MSECRTCMRSSSSSFHPSVAASPPVQASEDTAGAVAAAVLAGGEAKAGAGVLLGGVGAGAPDDAAISPVADSAWHQSDRSVRCHNSTVTLDRNPRLWPSPVPDSAAGTGTSQAGLSVR